MGLRIDTANAGCTTGADALLAGIGPDGATGLGVLSGADLCLLGATGYPVCSGALRSAWWELGRRGRAQLSDINTLLMLRRGLIKDLPAGPGSAALTVEASHPMSAELSVLLGARQSSAFICATQEGSPAPAFTYFPTGGAHRRVFGPGALVKESPEFTGDDTWQAGASPLAVNSSYRLLSQALAAEELARWAFEPAGAGGGQPHPARSICFFEDQKSNCRDSYDLVIHCRGAQAHLSIDRLGVSADVDHEGLTSYLGELVAQWSGQ
jgi:hypothetical protein